MEPWIEEMNAMRDLFDQRAGSLIESRITYLPTGTIETIRGYHNVTFLRLEGCRTFDAAEYDEMVNWCGRYDSCSLTWIRLLKS